MTEPLTDTEAPPEIEEVRLYRRAARLIVRAPRSRKDRLKALVRLGAKVRESDAGVVAELAVWEEAKSFVRNEPPPPPVRANNPAEALIRAQLRKGRVLCGGCLLPLPTEEQLDRARRGRIAEIERRRLNEEADK